MACAVDRGGHRGHRVGEACSSACGASAPRSAQTCVVGPVTGDQGAGFSLGLRTTRPAKEVQAELLERGILAGTASDPHILRLLPPFILEERARRPAARRARRICDRMKRFLDLARFRARRGARAARARAAPARQQPEPQALPARSSACCSSIRRCARWPRSRPAWRASAAAPSSSPRAGHLAARDAPRRGHERRRGRARARGRCRCSPPTAMRSASARSPTARISQADLAETTFNAMAALVDKPLINLESAHQPSLPGAGRLEDAG